MKLNPIAAALSCCALLSFAYGDVVPTEQSLAPLKEDSQEQLVAVEEPFSVQSLELQKILGKIPELVQNAADKGLTDEVIDKVVDNNTEVVPQEAPVARSREGKQLIGFIPAYVLREAIRMAQEQQDNIVRSLDYDDREDDDDDQDDEDAIEEERAIRRRKRFRRRNSKGHLQTSHRHQNLNKQRVTQRRRVNMKHQNEKRRKGAPKRKSPKKKQKKRRTKKRKPSKRRQQYD